MISDFRHNCPFVLSLMLTYLGETHRETIADTLKQHAMQKPSQCSMMVKLMKSDFLLMLWCLTPWWYSLWSFSSCGSGLLTPLLGHFFASLKHLLPYQTQAQFTRRLTSHSEGGLLDRPTIQLVWKFKGKQNTSLWKYWERNLMAHRDGIWMRRVKVKDYSK